MSLMTMLLCRYVTSVNQALLYTSILELGYFVTGM